MEHGALPLLWSPFQPLLDMCTYKLMSGFGQGKEEEKSRLSFHDCMCQKEMSELEELGDKTESWHLVLQVFVSPSRVWFSRGRWEQHW